MLNRIIDDRGSEGPGAALGSQRSASIVQQIRSSVENINALDPEDIDALLSILQQKKLSLRKYERQFEMATMKQFLMTAKAKKAQEMEVLRKELLVVEEDLEYVANQIEACASAADAFSSSSSQYLGKRGAASSNRGDGRGRAGADAGGVQVPNALTAEDGTLLTESVHMEQDTEEDEERNGSSTDSCGNSGDTAKCGPDLLLPRNKRVEEHYEDLETFYFDSRMRGSPDEDSFDEFLETLTTFARYEKFRPVATLRYGEGTTNTAIVASIEFDKDEELFAVAGVTRKIKVYDYNNVIQQADSWSDLAQSVQQRQRQWQRQRQRQRQRGLGQQEWWHREGDSADEQAFIPTAMQYPAVEFTNQSKISCLSFNPYIKSQLSCSDYNGTVTLWDVNNPNPVLQLSEHEKRAWSVDFSHTDPTRLCSGSDDGKIKVWTTNRRASVLTIEGKANVCCVRFNPLHGNILSFGSADHNVHCFDLRSPKQPLCVLRGHKKAVSYTRFLSPDEIISASTDSSLKLWNLRTQECVRTFTGHINEKNFVGLTTSGGEWVACGSENNTMHAYYHNLTRPAVVYKFGNCNPVTGVEQMEDDPSLFVSAVCWKNKTNTVLSANSQGIIKVLELV
ncbi:hypothetical protein GGI12_005222 [Dipsacomyces acuminosporus]|nr:hypothetical protein GGI12_005222 [Dipsacomyces acuminosporus]